MSLRAALLALLSAGPLTGYDAAKHFAASVGHVWNAPDSQIYPELRKMAAEGLLATRAVPWGSKGATKTEYTLTPAGADALRAWANAAHTYAPERDAARLRAAYLEWADHDAAERFFTEHLEHHRRERQMALGELERLEQGTSPVLVRRLAAFPDARVDRVVGFKKLAYRSAVARAETEIAWATEGLALLTELGSRTE